jgi:hypothetical protein
MWVRKDFVVKRHYLIRASSIVNCLINPPISISGRDSVNLTQVFSQSLVNFLTLTQFKTLINIGTHD